MNSRLIVLARATDAAAQSFAARHAACGARVVTPRDLSRPGWCLRLGELERNVAVIGDERIEDGQLTGVVTRFSFVSPADLKHIASRDRAYVAAEMTAFLLAWLSRVRCPVYNRPVPPSLAGPCWPWERWIDLALRAGVPAAPMRRGIGLLPSLDPGPAPTEAAQECVTIAGPATLGASDPRLRAHARTLARAASTDLLGVYFEGTGDGARVAAVDLSPDLGNAMVGDAVLRGMS